MGPFIISTKGWYWFVKMQGHIFDFTSLYKGLKRVSASEFHIWAWVVKWGRLNKFHR